MNTQSCKDPIDIACLEYLDLMAVLTSPTRVAPRDHLFVRLKGRAGRFFIFATPHREPVSSIVPHTGVGLSIGHGIGIVSL